MGESCFRRRLYPGPWPGSMTNDSVLLELQFPRLLVTLDEMGYTQNWYEYAERDTGPMSAYIFQGKEIV